MKHRQQREKIQFKVLFFELLGFLLVNLSGIFPFIHVLIEDRTLKNRFFGFTSIHRFAYSVGTHASLLFLCFGLFILVSSTSKTRFNLFIKNLKYSLISPLICAIFFTCWVFIPNIDFNLLAYAIIALSISITSIFIIIKILNYIKTLQAQFTLKEKLLEEGLNLINDKL